MIRLFDPEWKVVDDFVDDTIFKEYANETQDWSWGDGRSDCVIPPSAFYVIEKINDYLGKRYKLSTAKLLANNLDYGSYKFHPDNLEEDNIEIPDVSFTVVVYLEDCEDPLEIKDYNGNIHNVNIVKGRAVFFNGDVLHRATNFENTSPRKLLKFTFKAVLDD